MNHLKHLFTVKLIISSLSQNKALFLNVLCATAILKITGIGFFTHAFSSVLTNGNFNFLSLCISIVMALISITNTLLINKAKATGFSLDDAECAHVVILEG